VIAAP
jgi:hypothetical protein